VESWWIAHRAALYPGLLAAGFLLLACWETVRPQRDLKNSTGKRWLNHIVVKILNDVIGILVFRVGAVAFAFAVSRNDYGILNRPWIPLWISVIATFVLLDLVHYAGHYLLHSVPWLWRLHQVHHADREIDASTGVRFHPGETLFSNGLHFLAIAALAAPPIAVLFAELFGIVESLFSHANVTLPKRFEAVLRKILVTPRFHEIHHSISASDQQSNFSIVFPVWDRLFGTYRDAPELGEERIRFGLEEVSAEQSVRPVAMLALPFRPTMQSTSPPQSPATSALTAPRD
jgi:sterol desaturase/sphingolipid hydroxylase (fatty acid hydroxylase superfamily)